MNENFLSALSQMIFMLYSWNMFYFGYIIFYFMSDKYTLQIVCYKLYKYVLPCVYIFFLFHEWQIDGTNGML